MPGKRKPETKPEFIHNFVARIHGSDDSLLVGFVGPQNKLVTRIGSARKYGDFKGASAAGTRFFTAKSNRRAGVMAGREHKYYYEVVTVESQATLVKHDPKLIQNSIAAKQHAERVSESAAKYMAILFRYDMPTGSLIGVREEGEEYVVFTQTNAEDAEPMDLGSYPDQREAFTKAMAQIEGQADDDFLDMGDLLEAEDEA